MPRTTEEQAEQVARYAEILAAQLRLKRRVAAGFLAALLGFSIFALVLTAEAFAMIVAAVALSSASGVLGWALGRRERRDVERLASILHSAPPDIEGAGSTPIARDQG